MRNRRQRNPRARVHPPRTTASSRRRRDPLSPRGPLPPRVPPRRPEHRTASGSLSARWAPPRADRGERSRVREKPEHLHGEAVESRLLALTLRPQLASRPARRRGSRRGRDRRSRTRAGVDRVPRERPPDAGGLWSDGDRFGGLSHPVKPITCGRSGCARSCSESRAVGSPAIRREASASRQASVAAHLVHAATPGSARSRVRTFHPKALSSGRWGAPLTRGSHARGEAAILRWDMVVRLALSIFGNPVRLSSRRRRGASPRCRRNTVDVYREC